MEEEGRGEEAERDVIMEEEQRDVMLEERELPLLTLKMQEGTMNHRMLATSRSWKNRGNRFSPKACRRDTLTLA